MSRLKVCLLLTVLVGSVSWTAPIEMAAGDEVKTKVSKTSGRPDFNGDGFADLAVGAYEAVHVLYGSAVGLIAAGNQLWNQDSPGIEGLGFGQSLAVGDFNGDGFGDLAVNVRSESESVQSRL